MDDHGSSYFLYSHSSVRINKSKFTFWKVVLEGYDPQVGNSCLSHAYPSDIRSLILDYLYRKKVHNLSMEMTFDF